MTDRITRGVVPPLHVSTGIKNLINEIGEHTAADIVGVARGTVLRLAAGLPVTRPVLYTAEHRLQELKNAEAA